MRRAPPLLLYYPNHMYIGAGQQVIQHQWLPRRLLLVRHGESEANVDRTVYSTVPDWRIPLTALGREQAFDCGRRLKQIIEDERLYIYYSPYVRTQQTLEEIRKSLSDTQIQGEREDERLREQEMGNYQPVELMDQTWAARNRFSRLYYRFPWGESSADVGDRVSSFFDSLLRERLGLTVPNMNEGMMLNPTEEVSCLSMGRWSGLESPPYDTRTPLDTTAHQIDDYRVSDLGDAVDRGVLPPNSLGAAAGNDQNVVIVAHGLLIRHFIGRWFRVPMEVLETMCNPPNCAIVVLERNDAIGRLVMTDVSKQLFGSDPLLQLMKFDGQEDTQWYRERFLGIIDPDKKLADSLDEDDDENHYSLSTAHNVAVGAPVPYRSTRATHTTDTGRGVSQAKGCSRTATTSAGERETPSVSSSGDYGDCESAEVDTTTTEEERRSLSRWLLRGVW